MDDDNTQKINWEYATKEYERITGFKSLTASILQSSIGSYISTIEEARLFFTDYGKISSNRNGNNLGLAAKEYARRRDASKSSVTSDCNQYGNVRPLPKCPWSTYPVEDEFFATDVLRDYYWENTDGDYKTREKSPSLPEVLQNEDVYFYVRSEIAQRRMIVVASSDNSGFRWLRPDELPATSLAKICAEYLKIAYKQIKLGCFARTIEIMRGTNDEQAIKFIAAWKKNKEMRFTHENN